MRKKSSFRKIIFLVIFILALIQGSSGNISSSTHRGVSENLKHELITANNEKNVNSINYTTYKIDSSEALTNQRSNNEKLKVNNPLWSENFLNFATLLTSIVSLLTLNELKKQRYLASTPKLHIISPKNLISIKNKKYIDIEKELPTDWGSKDIKLKKSEDGDVFPSMYSIPLKIINTGSSSALNTQINWSYDHESVNNIVKQFNELGIGEEVEISHPLEDSHIGFSLKNRKYYTHLSNGSIDYILPYSNLNQETEIFIPDILSLFVILKLSVLSLSEVENPHEYSIFTLNAEITYYDNINVLHKENYNIQFHPIALMWEYGDKDTNKKYRIFEKAFISFDAQKINREKHLLTELKKESKKLRFKFRKIFP
jgi:hypothetical protein